MSNWQTIIVCAGLMPFSLLMNDFYGFVWLIALGLFMYFGSAIHPIFKTE